MEVRGTNIFDQEHIDWKSWVAALLWHNIVYHKNEFSGYEVIVKPADYIKHIKKGDIIGDSRLLSYYIGETRKLSWKELALALGFWKENMLPDYHNCEECKLEKGCKAYFKYDEDQERCSGWMEEYAEQIPSMDDEYYKFMTNLMKPVSKQFSVLKSLSKEEMDELMKELNKE